MSDSDVESDMGTGIKIPRFYGRRGDDYGLWRLRLRAACRVKGVWNVVEPTPASSATSATSSGTVPDSAIRISKLEKASGMIISALGDGPLRVVLDAGDDPVRMLQLLDARYASNRTVSRIAVQTQLFRMRYKDQDMSLFVDTYGSLFSQLEQMGKDAAIPESHKAPMLLASIDPDCVLESTAAALRTKDVAELTWDYVATTLIDEYNAKNNVSPDCERRKRNGQRRRHSQSSELEGKTWVGKDESAPSEEGSDIESTARILAAALRNVQNDRSVNRYDVECDFCGKHGHVESRCHLNPDNPDNRLPAKVLARIDVKGPKSSTRKTRKSAGKVEIAGTIIEETTVNPPSDHRSYADSGATAHCFHDASSFIQGTLRSCTPRTIILADGTSVAATQCGDVLMPFESANIRLSDVLYVPSMSFNLVSVGRLSDKGIESHFRRHDLQLTLETDGFIIGSGQRDLNSGLYMFPEVDMSRVCTKSWRVLEENKVANGMNSPFRALNRAVLAWLSGEMPPNRCRKRAEGGRGFK